MEVISENNNKKEDLSSINDQNSENIPELKLDEYPFQLTFNHKRTRKKR